MTPTKPCVLILSYINEHSLQHYIKSISKFNIDIFLAVFTEKPKVILHDVTCIIAKQKAQAIVDTLAKANDCTHIITVDVENNTAQDLKLFLQAIEKDNLNIYLGLRDFTAPNTTLLSRMEQKFSAFWLRVQTSLKLTDIHHNTKAYPRQVFDFINVREKGYAFDVEILVRAAWAGFNIVEIPINTPVSKTKIHFNDHIRMIALNTHFTLRALVPLPFKRFDRLSQERISLRHPITALRQLMNDPYNKATPWQLARTAGISMAILTVPAPIIQSIFLLLCIGWLKLNRLCAIAMIPLTWPPFLPGLAVLVGYRLRHGEWLTEFSIQTLGYEVGERLFEWVIGSIALTPVLGLALGLIVGLAAFMVAGRS